MYYVDIHHNEECRRPPLILSICLGKSASVSTLLEWVAIPNAVLTELLVLVQHVHGRTNGFSRLFAKCVDEVHFNKRVQSFTITVMSASKPKLR